MDILSPTVYLLIIGGIAGYLIGYLIKKVSHFALIIGIIVFLLMYMVYTKAINLDFDELGATVARFTGALAPFGLTALASSAPFVGSFVVGLVLGLKKAS